MKTRLALVLLLALSPTTTGQGGSAPGRPALLRSLGRPIGSPVRLTVTGAPLVGFPFGLEVEDGPADGFGYLFLGTRFSPSGRLLLAGPPTWRSSFRLDAQGKARTNLHVSSVPLGLVGRTLMAQAIVSAPSRRAAVSLTQGVQFRFGRPGSSPLLPAKEQSRLQTLDAVVSDLNGDGLTDVVAAKLGSGVFVQLAQGNGTFRGVWSSDGSSDFDHISLGDLDGDGVLDFVASKNNHLSTGTYQSFRGRGDGTFDAGPLAGVSGARGAVLADTNQDGNLDLVLSQHSPNQVELLLGQGDGTFLSNGAVSFPASLANAIPGDIVADDVNQDGFVDVLVGNAGSGKNIAQFNGRGDGTLVFTGTIDMGSASAALATVDLNQDGLLDLVAASAGTRRVNVRLGLQGGGFQKLTGILLKGAPVDLGFGDANADGFEDILAVMIGSKVRILLGDGTGALTLGQEVHTGADPNSPNLGQWTGDDRVDLLIFGQDAPAMTLYRGNPSGKFSAPIARSLGDPQDLAVVDLDGDAVLDVIVLDKSSDEVVVWLGKGSGGFTKVASRTTIQNPRAVSPGDFDGDGVPDLAVIRESAPELRILLGNGDGTFRKGQTTATSGMGVEVADLDGDGALDLAVARTSDVLVLSGRGDGKFDVGGAIPMGAGIWEVLLQDLDGDGVIDMATPNSGDDETGIRMGIGDGTFGPEMRYGSIRFPLALAAADLNGDGVSDLVTLSSVNFLDVRLGLGDGTFGPRQTFHTGRTGLDVAIADLDRDGVMDLVTANDGGNDVTWLRGRGDGSFEEPLGFVAGTNAEHLAIADLNGDFLPDVAVQLAHRDGFVVLFNQLLSETRSDR